MQTSLRRYGDNDSHIGPFTLSRSSSLSWRPFGVVLDSGGGEDRNGGCHLLLHGFRWTLILEMPRIVKPWRQWVDTSKYEWATSPTAGYWDEHPNRYGFTVSDGFLQVFLGPQTMDSSTTKSWSKFLPWTQWRYIRTSMYDLDGAEFWTQAERDRKAGGRHFDAQLAAEKDCPKRVFEFTDYDGALIQAVTHIEEREWHFGEGWFKWLSVFRTPKIRRQLVLRFSAEVGHEKGSWKGGMCGTGIDMLSGELHEAAFRRFCDQEHRDKSGRFKITFIRAI